jgi:hypothetical protein
VVSIDSKMEVKSSTSSTEDAVQYLAMPFGAFNSMPYWNKGKIKAFVFSRHVGL